MLSLSNVFNLLQLLLQLLMVNCSSFSRFSTVPSNSALSSTWMVSWKEMMMPNVTYLVLQSS
jgi:hypothetical protein